MLRYGNGRPFFLEPLVETLVPVFHVRRDRGFDLVQRIPEVFKGHVLSFDVTSQCDKSGFSADSLQISAGVASCHAGYLLDVHVSRHWHILHMNLQNLGPGWIVRGWDED